MMTTETAAQTTATMVFRRYEKKYMLNKKQYNVLISEIRKHAHDDEFGKTISQNLYLDTENYELIQTSLEKPLYKEKLRLRSYGVPKSKDSPVFLELKKKYNGVVYKRRAELTLQEADRYLYHGIYPKDRDCQILRELSFSLQKYRPVPKAYLSYERFSLIDNDDPELRITFDRDLTCRDYDLRLEKGSYGDKILDEDYYLMEIKTINSIPLWLTKALSETGAFPTTYSKYGTYYANCLTEQKTVFNKGGVCYA